jgi:uncharacterized NAD(P)/FAD-binding protein YdhS
MFTADSPAGEVPVVAVIGGGASGTLATVHLVRQAAARRLPLRVAWIDRHGRHGHGQAYPTSHPAHMLRAPADSMRAFGDDPGHLLRWAAERQIRYDGFLSRSSYGDYLTDVLAGTERSAAPAIRVSRICSHVVGIRRDCGSRALRLDLAAEGRIDADIAILATGSPPSHAPLPAAAGSRFIDPLLRRLLENGLARTDPLGLELDSDALGAVLGPDGTAAGDIYALGPLLGGLPCETTALPEIRAQAEALAGVLAVRIAQAGPRSAA